MKYKVQVQAVVTATVWVECSDEHEAKSIAESARGHHDWTERVLPQRWKRFPTMM